MKESNKMHHACAIDLGTQTFRLAVAAICQGKVVSTRSFLRNVRLGEGLHETGVISEQALKRGAEVMKEFSEIIGKLPDASPVSAAGTAALRVAANADKFIDASKALGMEVKVLSQREELETAARGVLYTISQGNLDAEASESPMNIPSDILIMDPGGGSTEISHYQKGKLAHWASLPLGAVTLTNRFLKSEPAMPREITALCRYVSSELSGVKWLSSLPGNTSLIATGGTATTLAAMEQELEVYDPSKIRGMKVSKDTIDSWCNRLSSMTTDEKHCISGLEPERSDIILAGMIIIQQIMDRAGFPAITVSDGGLLLGLLIRVIEKEYLSNAESSCPGGLYV